MDQLDALALVPAERTPAAAQMAQRTDHLLELKSLGPVFSAGLVNEAFYKDFRNQVFWLSSIATKIVLLRSAMGVLTLGACI